jgi:hypothetical protein
MLQATAGCFDDLVVVHDGAESSESCEKPDRPPEWMANDYSRLARNSPLPRGFREIAGIPVHGSIHELVARYGGRYFEGPRCFQQEPHWPFAWAMAKHDWILRLDADEFPSEGLRDWLIGFRGQVETPAGVPGYTCIWPLWDGTKAVTRRWPDGRNFLFDKRRVRFFGMAEQTPVPDQRLEPLKLVLEHRPRRKSFGVRNLVGRAQAARWRRVIALSLLGDPQQLPCWRWGDAPWPPSWEQLRRRPLLTGLKRLVRYPLAQTRSMITYGEFLSPEACFGSGLHQFLMGATLFLYQWRNRPPPSTP